MLKTVLAVVAAAVCAGAIVGFVPEPSPADAASASAANGGTAGCAQPWPYYERACLCDSRKHSGNARAVRVIAIADHAIPHTAQKLLASTGTPHTPQKRR
jgi:hypothetical protein